MMKNQKGWVMCAIVGLILVVSVVLCGSPRATAESTTASSLHDKSKILILFSAAPAANYSIEYPKYNVSCQIYRVGEGNDFTEFNNAIVTVNNTALRVKSFGVTYYFSARMDLSEGATVKVHISHPAVGEIDETLTVPDTVLGMTIDPADLTKWANGTVPNITVSWPATQCTYYMCLVDFLDKNKRWYYSLGNSIANNTITLGQDVLAEDVHRERAFITLKIYGINMLRLDGFAEGSRLMIQSPLAPEKTTLPSSINL